MAKVSCRKVRIIDDGDQKELTHYFNQMTGKDSPDIAIIEPKYRQLVVQTIAVRNAIDAFAGVVARHDDYSEHCQGLVEFAARLGAFAEDNSSDKPLDPCNWAGIKNHSVVNELLLICSNLLEIRVALDATWATVDKNFMERCTGPTFVPFPMSRLNFRRLWDMTEELRELMFVFLQSVYVSCHDVYKIVTSPDVDVQKLCKIIIGALANLRKQVPRCEKAFKKIEESATLLENNFEDYYKDFLQSNDSTNIFTSFVSDVATNCEHDAQLIFQCRTIVNYFRKAAQQQIASGKMDDSRKAIYESLFRQYTALDKKATEISEEKKLVGQSTSYQQSADDIEQVDGEPDAHLVDIDELIRQIEDPRVSKVDQSKKSGKKDRA